MIEQCNVHDASAPQPGGRLAVDQSAGPGVERDGFRNRKVMAFATFGGDRVRLEGLLQLVGAEFISLQTRPRLGGFLRLIRKFRRTRPGLVIMEGTGVAGGAAVMLSRLLLGTRYVVSSGDAVGPFLARKYGWLWPIFNAYERMLYRWSAGFIGWSQYFVGRALTYGAPRAMTAGGWADFRLDAQQRRALGDAVRRHLGIAPATIVVGIAGSLNWNRRVGYCYGLELVRALRQTARTDLCALIVGDGDGRRHLEKAAGADLGTRVILTGKVTRWVLPGYLAAMDAGSLPQSVDQVGALRYTTKLSEYLAASLPIITGQLPLAYDLGGDWLWRLPGNSPWDDKYIASLTTVLDNLTPDVIETKRAAIPRDLPEFDRNRQIRAVTAFLNDILSEPG